MGFLTPAMLAGLGLIAMPIVLHLIMRRQPREFSFPALQFVKQRQDANRRKLNFRHLLLLALRCLLIAGIAFALARPTLRGTGLKGKEGAPLAVALVVDNSLRMQYIERNEPRLVKAGAMASSLAEKLPDDTEIAVVDLSRAASSFAADKGTAATRLRGLSAETNPRPLAEAIRNAVKLVAEQTERRQEVFVFSDMNAVSFDEGAIATIQQVLDDSPDVRIYIVDVGSGDAKNIRIAPLEIRATSLRPGEPLNIGVDVFSAGYTEQPLVEIFLEDATGKLVKRGQRIVEMGEDGKGQTEFILGDLPLGTHQGVVQLATTDPLLFDNKRYFTVEVKEGANVLLLGETNADTLFLREALRPSLLGADAPKRFNITVDRFADASQTNFDEFDAVCLLDPSPLSDEVLNKLAEYARKGGGVGFFLGHRATPSGFNGDTPQKLLPGTLKLRSRDETWFKPQRLDHPALAALRDYAEEIPWQIYPVWTYWQFGDLAGDAYIVARFANNQPALVERPVGRGRVMTFTTPWSDPLSPVGRESWNALPTQNPPWPFVALANQLVGYLTQSDAGESNFLAGETVNLQLSPKQQVTDFVLKEPEGEALRRTLPPGEDAIRISTTHELGNYRVAAGGRSGALDEGFSVNAAADLSLLDRIDPASITAALPKDRVHLAESLDDVEEYVNIGRSGRELFPWAILFVALVWGSEHWLANRFYRAERQP
jgi:hypothetical protein